MTALEFAAKRRVRLNGRLAKSADNLLVIDVEQPYGNCPQYIPKRLLRPRAGAEADESRRTENVRRDDTLAAEDLDLIRGADTFFLGTANPDRGTDASHPGGARGFVRLDDCGLWWPDYRGNNIFNSFVNLEVNPEAALLLLDFTPGRTLHLSGRGSVEWGRVGRPGDDDSTARIARFGFERLVAGALLPVCEATHRSCPRNPTVPDPRVAPPSERTHRCPDRRTVPV